MPRSLILQTVSKALLFLIVMFSLFLFLEGHNAPGGGFIAGLIAAGMILIQFMAFSRKDLKEVFQPVFHKLVGLGLVLAGGSGFFGWFAGMGFLTGYHWSFDVPWGGHLAIPSVLIFDLGVYLIVIGMIVSIFMALEEKRL
ncbi:MAG: MnhB domain-containing protein [bacterium]